MKKNLFTALAAAVILLSFTSCEKKDPTPTPTPATITKVVVTGQFLALTATESPEVKTEICSFTFKSYRHGVLKTMNGLSDPEAFSLEYTAFPVQDTIVAVETPDATKIVDATNYIVEFGIKPTTFTTYKSDGTSAKGSKEIETTTTTRLSPVSGAEIKNKGVVTEKIFFVNIEADGTAHLKAYDPWNP